MRSFSWNLLNLCIVICCCCLIMKRIPSWHTAMQDNLLMTCSYTVENFGCADGRTYTEGSYASFVFFSLIKWTILSCYLTFRNSIVHVLTSMTSTHYYCIFLLFGDFLDFLTAKYLLFSLVHTSFFMGFSMMIVALLARLRVLVQQVRLCSCALFL